MPSIELALRSFLHGWNQYKDAFASSTALTQLCDGELVPQCIRQERLKA